jgi:hypothetical protein
VSPTITPTAGFLASADGQPHFGPVPCRTTQPFCLFAGSAVTKLSVTFYNASGEVVLRGDTPCLDVSRLASGIYYLLGNVETQAGGAQALRQKIIFLP